MPQTQNGSRLVRRKIPTVLVRAGTSKGLFFKSTDLPSDRVEWQRILLACMGSPDPYGKQLDGLGGGSSTTSKIAVVGPSTMEDVDLDYTFVAVPIGGESLDFTGNCGNMASGVGPFAVEEKLVQVPDDGEVSVTIRNTNTGIILRSTFVMQGGLPVEEGECRLDGVSSAGSPIRLDFLNPAGSMTGKLLPTGNAIDDLTLEENPSGLARISASMVDASNPFVFVHAADLGLSGHEPAAKLVPLTATLMRIREAAAVAMGLAASRHAASLVPGTPKIAILGSPAEFTTSSGREVPEEGMDLHVRPFSMGAPHPSLQMTGAVCLAAACAVKGSIANDILRTTRKSRGAGLEAPYRFAHASGVIETASEAEVDQAGNVHVKSASVYRTARRLIEGQATYLAPSTA